MSDKEDKSKLTENLLPDLPVFPELPKPPSRISLHQIKQNQPNTAPTAINKNSVASASSSSKANAPKENLTNKKKPNDKPKSFGTNNVNNNKSTFNKLQQNRPNENRSAANNQRNDNQRRNQFDNRNANNWRNNQPPPYQRDRNLNSSQILINNTNFNNNRPRELAHLKNQQPNNRTNQPAPIAQQRKTASDDVQRFWHQLAKRVLHTKNNKFTLNVDEHSLWFQTWKAAAAQARGPIRALPVAYLMLPASTVYSPAPLTIISVLTQVAMEIKRSQSQRTNDTDIAPVNVLEAVFDIVNLRLTNQVSQPECFAQTGSNHESLLAAINQMEQVLFEVIAGSLAGASPQHTERLARLLLRKNDIAQLKKRIEESEVRMEKTGKLTTDSHAILAKSILIDEVDKLVKPWLGWQNKPTLGWLMSDSWHKTDGLKGFYHSPGEYAQELLRVWTLLTYYWGSGAVWPKCSHTQRNDKDANESMACGEPMMVCAGAKSGQMCRSGGCSGRRGKWKCFRANHDALCEHCVVRQQSNLVGSPSPQASTDIYDAVIEREVIRREETVYLLKSVQSRKPPRIAPNWKTSYRLPVSVLVAVIKLSVSGEPLTRTSVIQWGEIVAYNTKDGINQDWTYRSQGRMAVRLLNKADCAGMCEESESHVDVGSHIAIIDLRVFVPEVISVLSTFAKQDFKDQLDQIPFFLRLIGHQSPQDCLPAAQTDPNLAVHMRIKYALEASEIDFIQRLDVTAKSQLIQEICALKPIQMLSGTQLDAFAGALFSSVHCTQGPPGTGKSYIGVCLVLALNLIRKKAEAYGHAVGPVLVLSYKNHALDEFLLDVISQYNSTGSDPNNRYRFGYDRLRPGMLIRTGKPDIENLSEFTERHSPLELDAQRHLMEIIDVQRNARNVRKLLYDCARSLDTKALLEAVEDIDWFPSEMKFTKSTQANADPYSFTSMVLCCALELIYQVTKASKGQGIADDAVTSKPTCLMESINERIRPNVGFNLLRRGSESYAKFRTDDFFDFYKPPADLEDSLSGIAKNIEHWKKANNQSRHQKVYFLLRSWLKGITPPGRCQAILDGARCLEEAAYKRNTPFCSLLHRCHSKNCQNERLSGPRIYCIEHSCSQPGCQSKCLQNCQFCASHVCIKCLVDHTSSQSIKAAEPLACEQHRCSAPRCDQMQVLNSPSLFCAHHACQECLTSGSGKLIKARVTLATQFCMEHKCSMVKCQGKRLDASTTQCVYHICRVCSTNGIKDGESYVSADPNCPQSQLCAKHRCSHYSQCSHETFKSSAYCNSHSCRECIVQNSTPILAAVHKAPRNTCDKHHLCQYVSPKGKECSSVTNGTSLYCLQHTAPPKLNKVKAPTGPENRNCASFNARGKPCKTKDIKRYNDNFWYCDAHKNQAKSKASAVQEAVSSDSSDNEQEEEEIIDFKPVLDLVEPVKAFRQVKCSSKGPLCNVIGLLKDNDLPAEAWLCPVHQNPDIGDKDRTVVEQGAPNAVKSEEIKSITLEKLESRLFTENCESDKKGEASSEIKQVIVIEKDVKPQETVDKVEEKFDDPIDTDMEKPNANTHPDEMDDYYDEEDQVNEELRRLQEVTEIGDLEDEVIDEAETMTEDAKIAEQNETAEQMEDMTKLDISQVLSKWTWDSSQAERLVLAGNFLRYMGWVFTLLGKLCERYLSEARKRRAEAGAQAFRGARIIGATVVGASRRLEALRAAGPFAVVVEEACEVIEPTLMSVLSCNTLRKLELIGDHRQLPAFVQQCWFTFETTMPSIKVSLFERLVSNSSDKGRYKRPEDNSNLPSSVVPCTILDEQRRMRSSIADISRPEYTDLVDIIDHTRTNTQCIGDVVIASCPDKRQIDNTILHRSMWPASGRDVPGLGENIFFWDLENNAESRPVAGLSACNQAEAEAVASLTKWLLVCGCPPASITIITPYKGQKMAITQALRKKDCLTPFRRDAPPPRGTTLTVSTVDRYQGDENDIVILSLVRCRPGNRFVGLKNRFVVAVSRARLGLFIVGSAQALTTGRNGPGNGPAHWLRFIQSLKTTKVLEPDAQLKASSSLKKTKVLEPDAQLKASSSLKKTESNASLIKKLIAHFHSSKDQSTNGMASELNAEADKSPTKLASRELFANLERMPESTRSRCGSGLPICCPRHQQSTQLSIKNPKTDFPDESSWHKFCSLPCQAFLTPCGHACSLPCHSPVKTPHNPKCKFEFKRPCDIHAQTPLLCFELNMREAESTRAESLALARFQCQIKVDYPRPECNHSITLMCYQKTMLLKDPSLSAQLVPECVIQVSNYIHPVCGHEIIRPECHKKRAYEQKPPNCMEKVKHSRPCGCVSDMRCYESMEELKKPSKCNSSVNIARPRCGHVLSMRCFMAINLMSDWQEQSGESAFDNASPANTKLLVTYGKQYGPKEGSLNPQIPDCLVKVNYTGPCGHQTDQPCTKAFEFASKQVDSPECNSLKPFACPICNRTHLQLECWLVELLTTWKLPANEPLNVIDLRALSVSLSDLKHFSAKAIKHLQRCLCKSRVPVYRTCFPDHRTMVTCHKLLDLLLTLRPLDECAVPTDRTLPCRHVLRVACNQRNQNPAPLCMQPIDSVFTFPCGMHSVNVKVCSKYTALLMDRPKCAQSVSCARYRCGHNIIVPCYLKHSVAGTEPFEYRGLEFNMDMPTQVIVKSNGIYSEGERDVNECTELVSYRYEDCGHVRPSVKCPEAFSWAVDNDLELPCDHMDLFSNPICGHELQGECHQIKLIRAWDPWANTNAKRPICSEYVYGHDEENGVILAYSVDEEDLSFKLSPPKGIMEQSLACQVVFNVKRACGHSVVTTCSKAYWKTYKQCDNLVAVECPKPDCRFQINMPCRDFTAKQLSGKPFVCKNKVDKLCQKCHMNKVKIECSKVAIECLREVSARLDCGHEVSWECGSEEDPRLNAASCQQCVHPKWEELISKDSDLCVDDNKVLMAQIITRIEQTTAEYSKELELTIFDEEKASFVCNLTNHINCRPIIVSRYFESSKSAGDKLALPKTRSLIDIGYYDFVFMQIENKLGDGNKFEQAPTIYGRGCELNILSNKALTECKPNDEGLIHLLIGAAFRFRACDYSSQPFCSSLNKKGKQAANRVSNEKKEQGFDCIVSTPPDKMTQKIIYWEPGACIALGFVTLKSCKPCSICLDYFTGDEAVFTCSKDHSQCWECFEQNVKQAYEPGAVGRVINPKNGNLFCPLPECDVEISLLDVSKGKVPDSIFKMYEKHRSDFEANKVVEKALKEQETRMIKERERLMAIIDKEERDAELMRLDVIENILTLRCPRCKTAFIDFTGCAALTCSTCPCGFCALCLKDCGSDAHSHIRQCPEKRTADPYFIPMRDFNECHRKRREDLINQKIKNMSDKARRLLLNLIKKELDDLGIKIK